MKICRTDPKSDFIMLKTSNRTFSLLLRSPFKICNYKYDNGDFKKFAYVRKDDRGVTSWSFFFGIIGGWTRSSRASQ